MGKTMWFLIKGTFWFSMVLVLLPFLDASTEARLGEGPKVELGETFTAAGEAFRYISAICSEKPEVCEKGSETFVALGHRAREGARIAYEFLGEQFVAPDDAVMTGTVQSPAPTETPLAAIETDGFAEPSFKRMPVPEPRIAP